MQSIIVLPIITLYLTAFWWRGLTALLSQCVSFSLIDVGRVSSAYAILFFSFFFDDIAAGPLDAARSSELA
eukprot:scaffold161545_cov15-Tisochrysis_lutea.AAC.1